MPNRNFMRPTMPTQADVTYSMITIHDQTNDLAKDFEEESLARAAERKDARLRRSRIISTSIMLLILALFAAYAIMRVLTN